LISLDKKVQGLIVPSKLAGILAVGRPVIFLGDKQNSVASAIFKEPCGYVVPEGDFNQLTAIIEKLRKDTAHRLWLGEAARNLFIKKYDRAVIVPKIISKIENKPIRPSNK
jgi:glycosyltransferase involved in cell wall biosynthesis